MCVSFQNQNEKLNIGLLIVDLGLDSESIMSLNYFGKHFKQPELHVWPWAIGPVDHPLDLASFLI